MVPFISGYARFPHSGIFIVTSSIWGSIDREVDVLKSQGVDLISHCKRRIGTNKVCSVASKFQDSIVSSFRRQVRGGAENSQFAQLQELVGPTILFNSVDRWYWDLNGCGEFCVKDVRILLDAHFLPKEDHATRWAQVQCRANNQCARLEGCPSIGSYSDWLSWNQLLFADKKPRKDTFFDDIVALSFLWYENKMKFVEQPTGPAPDPETADPDTIDKNYETVNLEQEVACLMLSSMSPDLQRTLEKYNAYDMLKELKTMFEEQAKQELFETVKAFHACYAMPHELRVSLILNSLNKDYDQFVQNYNMHSMRKTIAELHAMLKLHEKGIPNKAETPAVLAIWEGKIQKDKRKPRGAKGKDKGKNKLVYAPKPKISPPPKRDNPAKDSICHHCKEGLRRSKKLKHGTLSLYMCNEMRAAVEAIRSFDLILSNGLIIVLHNCHFAFTITRGAVSISRLVENGYIHTFTNYGISVSKDNVFYFNAIPHDGIYEIDMHNLYPNVSSTFNVSNKRVKYSLDSSYLWYCRVGNIKKKRMDKLQRDGILQSIHDESLEKCKSCIIGKMAPKPFSHQVERAEDLLGLIHTDVCGPFRTVSREGASYFITFTDDFSRYGYVYLMKHKHEVFETFKVFQNEVENKLALPKSFWGYALESAARILNMVQTKKVERTPYEI
ncbi:retrotransposon protein, putative, ty1-copia subclass [Tanacetum coccineum]